jgi:hypothetical protein
MLHITKQLQAELDELKCLLGVQTTELHELKRGLGGQTTEPEVRRSFEKSFEKAHSTKVGVLCIFEIVFC